MGMSVVGGGENRDGGDDGDGVGNDDMRGRCIEGVEEVGLMRGG